MKLPRLRARPAGDIPDLPSPRPGWVRGFFRALLERVLRLFHTARAADTPGRLRLAALLVLIYFVFPFDLISDLMPFFGFGDDLTALSLLGWRLSRHTTNDIRRRARAQALRIIP